MDSFLDIEEVKKIGLKKFGDNVLISRKASFYNPGEIVLGNNVRIDDFCLLSGTIKLGSFVHISAFCALYGSFSIELMDHSGLSPRCTILSATDDFGGDFLVGPMHKPEYTNVTGGKVTLEKYVQIGSGSVVLPNIVIGEGSVTGAMSLVSKNLEKWGIYAGIPARKIRQRSKELLKLL